MIDVGKDVLGSEDGMAQVIQFYIPDRYKDKRKWIPADKRGQIIHFPEAVKKSA